MSGRLGSLLDAHECRVDFEHVRKVLGAHRSEVVGANTENNGNLPLMGADSVNSSQSRPSGRFDSICGALEIRDGRVEFECPSQELCAR